MSLASGARHPMMRIEDRASPGSAVYLRGNAAGAILVAPADTARDHPAAAASRVVSAAPTRPLLFVVVTTAAAGTDRYFMFFDAAALPANGTAPLVPGILMVGGDETPMSLALQSSPTTTGLVWAVSSTQATLTAAAETFDVGSYHLP